jgi:putative ABC transport system permease protein
MFRYKKRAFMTIVGVAGCASLLLVAFGLRDSMNGVAGKQYGDILRYDNMIILKDEVSEINGELKEILDKEQIIDPLLIKQSTFKYEKAEVSLDFLIVVPQNDDLFEEYYSLKSVSGNKIIGLEDDSVIVTQRFAKIYKLKKGDVLTVKDADNNSFELTVSDIAENYTMNYVYMDSSMYEKVFGETATFNAVVSKSTEKANSTERLLDSDLIVNVIFTEAAMETAHANTQRLNGVIVLIAFVASLLALVVLFNLTAINISERTREIATLKVLGFRDGETNAYIYREALLLTFISIGIGMVLGIGLHRFVLDIIESGALSLPVRIEWFSYVMSFLLTMIFSLFMQVITYFKLKKIDMIQSLKSVE